MAVLLLCISSTLASADNVTYWCPGGDWSTVKCWITTDSKGNPVYRLPNSGDTAHVTGIQTQVTLDMNASPGNVYIDANPFIGQGSGVFVQPGNSLQTNDEGIGPYGSYIQDGGTNLLNGSLALSAAYILKGGLLTAQQEDILTVSLGTGDSVGVFLQNGGTNDAGDYLEITSDLLSNTPGNYKLNAGILEADTEVVGRAGKGVFAHSGGLNDLSTALGSRTLYLGYNSGDNGEYQLSGTGRLSAYEEYVGYGGCGQFVQSGDSSQNEVNTLTVQSYASTCDSSSYTLSAGSLNASTEELCGGGGGQGIFTQTGGTNKVTNKLVLGYGVDCVGRYYLSGKNAQLSVSDFELVGTLSAGEFYQTGGVNFVTGPLTISGETTEVPSSGYVLSGDGYLFADTVTNGGLFSYSGGWITAKNVTNNGGATFAVSGGGIRKVTGNFINNGKLTCDSSTFLLISGTFTNNGTVQTTCHIIH